MKSRRSCILAGVCGIAGVLLLGLSFAINNGPPAGAGDTELQSFAQHNYTSVLWGAWLQAVGPALIVLFAFAIVHLADAAHTLAGWMTFFGATSLTTVSFIEITFYISALNSRPTAMASMSLAVIAAVQHLYFIVAAPAVFFPLGAVIYRSDVLPKIFGYLAMGLACLFGVLGAVFMIKLNLPDSVTACAAVQALWWLAAAITLIVRSEPISRNSRFV
jgi:hypothetical protein